MKVTKIDGSKELFSPAKLCLSLRKAGAPRTVADEICKKVSDKVKPDDSTTKIFRKALTYLVGGDMHIAARYSLRRGLESLGPSGFIFEQYIETVLQAYGFATSRNKIIKGKCLSHETDVIASIGSKRFIIEAKYRNEPSIKTHVDVVMYADARLLDIVRGMPKKAQEEYENAMWVITNTKFTESSITYAKCRGIRLTGWNYPRGASLEDVISQKRLYPITVLPSLPLDTLPQFAKKGIILAQDLLTYTANDLMQSFGLNEEESEMLIQEARGIVGPFVD
jgi:hypothetical protein